MLSSLWRRYLDILHRRPMLTQVVQTALLMGLGDVMAQRLLEKNQAHDVARTVRFMGLGGFLVAPTIRGWYMTMEKLVGPKVAPFRATISKVAMDQLGFAPTFNAIFITTLGVLQGKNGAELQEKFKSEYVDVMVANWKVWPLIQLVNFFFVPFLLRPLVVGLVALFWNSYLSWKTNRL